MKKQYLNNKFFFFLIKLKIFFISFFFNGFLLLIPYTLPKFAVPIHNFEESILTYVDVKPPSTIKFDPVIYEELFEARKKEAFAMSLALPILFNEVFLIYFEKRLKQKH